jgi:hypothetical protein
MYLYLTWNVKLSIRNTKVEIINQHKNHMGHVESLDENFYLSAPTSFYLVFTLVFLKTQTPLHFTLFYETLSYSTF